MKKIFIAGTFDLFHVGHQWLLWQAIKLGDSMTVVVACDKNVKRIKSRDPIWNQKKRLKRVQLEKLPNTKVILGSAGNDFLQTLQSVNPSLLVCGYDQVIPDFIAEFCTDKNIMIHRLLPYFSDFFKSSRYRPE